MELTPPAIPGLPQRESFLQFNNPFAIAITIRHNKDGFVVSKINKNLVVAFVLTDNFQAALKKAKEYWDK